MALVFVYVALLSFNVEYLTLPMRSLECIVDEAGNVAVLDLVNASQYGTQQDRGVLRVRHGGSKRYVADMELRRKLESAANARNAGAKSRYRAGSGGGGGGGSSSNHSSRRSKRSPNKRKKGSQHQQQYYDDSYEYREYNNIRSTNSSCSRSRHGHTNHNASSSWSFPSIAANHSYAYGTETNAQSDDSSESESENWFGVLGANTAGSGGDTTRFSRVEIPSWRHVWNEGTDAVMDIPIGGVCEVLYSGD